MNFQQKCFGVFDDLRAQGKTLVVVSHGLEVIKAMSDRTLYVNQGRAVFLGDPQEAVERFKADAAKAEYPAARKKGGVPAMPDPLSDGQAAR
jgi:ABC-type polysaccharide/polyol phosphate transport system ATPase subunit